MVTREIHRSAYYKTSTINTSTQFADENKMRKQIKAEEMHADRLRKQTEHTNDQTNGQRIRLEPAVFFVCEDGACWWGRAIAGLLMSISNSFKPFKTPLIIVKNFSYFLWSDKIFIFVLNDPRTKNLKNREGFEIKNGNLWQWCWD